MEEEKEGVKQGDGGLKTRHIAQMTRKWWNYQGGPHGRLTLTLTTTSPPPLPPLPPPNFQPNTETTSLSSYL